MPYHTMNDPDDRRQNDNRTPDDSHYGESGLSADCFDEDYSPDNDSCMAADTRMEIIRAILDAGFEPGMVDDRQFREYFDRVAKGPGSGWDPYRQARFALQTMNRCGVIDRPQRNGKDNRKDNRKEEAHPDISGPAAGEKQSHRSESEVRERPPHGNLTLELLKDYFSDYHRLSADEIKDNLIVVGGILAIVALAAVSVAVGVALSSPAVGAGGGAISVAAFVAVASRLAGRYHHRFGLPYRILRLVICLALLFTRASWVATRELWMLVYETTRLAFPIPAFGVTVAVILLLSSVWTHITLCRTSLPSKALFLGWLEALEVTFALGALMFGAVYK